jgi:hypothetical protein
MRQPTALFPIALALGATILVPGPGARAAPIAITACQTISQPGSYVLANNLTGSGDCLVIITSFVTINLAGFSISASLGGTGILVTSGTRLQGIAVRNGSITAGDAVNLDASDGSIVEGLRVSVSRAGISATGIVRDNTVIGSSIQTPLSSFGINASGIVTDNYVTGFGRAAGIVADGTIRGNTVTLNTEGIHAGVGSTLIGNTAMNNSGFIGIGISVDCPSNLTDNTAVNNRPGPNLVLNGEGCHNEDNVAP